MKNILMVSTVSFLFFIACKSGKNISNPRSKSIDESSLPIYKTSINGMISVMEDNKRDIWQKPDVIIKSLGNIKKQTIYDLGAGTGYFSTKFANQGAYVIVAEPDPRFLEFLNRKVDSLNNSKIEVRQIPFDNPMLKKQEVDWVFCANTYQLINNRIEYFTKVKLGIKPNGKLMLVNHKKIDSPNGPPKGRRISISETVTELQKSGYKIESVDSTSLPENYIIIAK
jgi:SAM-dependent methyltransferase